MKKKIELNEDHIKLIRFIKFEKFVFDKNSKNERFGWGVDQYSLFGGSYFLEDASRILNVYDQHIAGTENDPLGVDFPDEIKNYMWDLYSYIYTNLEYIFDLILYYCDKGGIKAGTYQYDTYEGWERLD